MSDWFKPTIQIICYSSLTHTYMLTFFTHNCVCQLAYKDAVNKVHLHTFLPVCWWKRKNYSFMLAIFNCYFKFYNNVDNKLYSIIQLSICSTK